MPYPRPVNESQRLEALRRYQLLDTDPEQGFDDITALASHICGVPIARMSLVDKDRQWFKSRVGSDVTETPREESICTYAIMDSKSLVICDAHCDDRFRAHPAVTGDPHVRFYVGAPLINNEGFALGVLCVVDMQPHEISNDQIGALETLARQVVAQMDLRRTVRELATVLEGVHTLQGLLPICAWCKQVRDDEGYWRNVEHYITESTGAKMTHCMCPRCSEEHANDV